MTDFNNKEYDDDTKVKYDSDDGIEFIEDAYKAIQNEINKGNIVLIKYEDFIKTKKDWLYRTIQKEYDDAVEHPEYRYFLINKFPFLNK